MRFMLSEMVALRDVCYDVGARQGILYTRLSDMLRLSWMVVWMRLCVLLEARMWLSVPSLWL